MRSLERLAKCAEYTLNPHIDDHVNCQLLDNYIADAKRPADLDNRCYAQLIQHMLTCLTRYRRLSVVSLKLAFPYGCVYPDNATLDRFLNGFSVGLQAYCERRGLVNHGYQYAYRRTPIESGVERFLLVLYLPQTTTTDVGFYHPTMDNIARVIMDSWVSALGVPDSIPYVSIGSTFELRDNTTYMVPEYMHVRRLLYPLAAASSSPVYHVGPSFGLSPIV